MTITTENKLTSYVFSGVTDPTPTQWPLVDYIPEGILLLEHLQARWRSATSYWTDWQPVVAFDPITRIATLVVPAGTIDVEFKRSTPRFALVRDPLSPTSRVSAPHLQINADQGMMVALEWAAQYGVDGHLPLVSGLNPISIGNVQHTQNHWAANTDFSKKTWNFRFTGGYLDPSHVKAQALVDGVWTAVPLDYTPWNNGVPNGAPFRMIGPYQLHLDLATLGGTVTGLVIFRRTPREFSVSSPPDAAQITAGNMTPSAKHAFFVAVELGEEFSRNVPSCECKQVFTTEGYMVVLDPEGLTGDNPATAGKLAPAPNWTDNMGGNNLVIGGTLRASLQKYQTGIEEKLTGTNNVQAGTLVTVLQRYVNGIEEKLTGTHNVAAGTLVTVLVRYQNAIEEKLTGTHNVIGGTLV